MDEQYIDDIQLEWTDFRKKVQRLNDTRKHKATNSVGVYDAYKWIRKNKWLDIGRPLTEHEFYRIVRLVNDYLAEELSNGNDIVLPHRLGRIEIRKYNNRVDYVNGELKINYPIDWDSTLKLWYEDSEAFKNKTLVYLRDKESFKVYYNRNEANYTNKGFFVFKVNREVKTRLKQNIRDGKIDAFIYK